MALREEKEFAFSGKQKGQCSRGGQGSFRHESNDRAKPTPKAAPPSEPPTPRGRSASRKRSLSGRSQSGKSNRQPCKNFLKGTCTELPFDCWHPPDSSAHRQVEGQPSKKPKKCGDKSAVDIVKDVRQFGCVFQDTEPPESAAISRKGTKVLGPIRRVRFTQAALRQASIRENKGPSIGKLQVKSSHQRSPCAVKFEDRSQEETERQERCARGDTWKLAKNIFKLKETEKATFYSPSDEWVLTAASTIKPQESEFVVDSGASMHMVSRKDLNSAQLETVRASKSPTTVVTANGEVQTKGEATVYIRELDLFATVCFSKMFFHSENSAKITGTITIGPVVRNHISSKMARELIATQRTVHHSLSLVCRQALQPHLLLLLLHLHRRKA